MPDFKYKNGGAPPELARVGCNRLAFKVSRPCTIWGSMGYQMKRCKWDSLLAAGKAADQSKGRLLLVLAKRVKAGQIAHHYPMWDGQTVAHPEGLQRGPVGWGS